MNTTSQIKFYLEKISTEQFAILGDVPAGETQIAITTDGRFGCDPENKLLGVFAKIVFSDESDKPFLQIEAGCHFKISPKDWETCLNKEIDSIEFPKDFAVHLLMLCLGTTRGILHAKLENTPYSQFFIPLIDATKLVEKNLVFPIAE